MNVHSSLCKKTLDVTLLIQNFLFKQVFHLNPLNNSFVRKPFPFSWYKLFHWLCVHDTLHQGRCEGARHPVSMTHTPLELCMHDCCTCILCLWSAVHMCNHSTCTLSFPKSELLSWGSPLCMCDHCTFTLGLSSPGPSPPCAHTWCLCVMLVLSAWHWAQEVACWEGGDVLGVMQHMSFQNILMRHAPPEHYLVWSASTTPPPWHHCTSYIIRWEMENSWVQYTIEGATSLRTACGIVSFFALASFRASSLQKWKFPLWLGGAFHLPLGSLRKRKVPLR